jgi:hypothetical protein
MINKKKRYFLDHYLYYLEDPGVDMRIILKWMYKKWEWGAWTGLIRLRIRTDRVLL